ncbi:hypothetical protein [Roseovarius sp. D22-M7]|uniref:hypothetical protein n=1 Tax=Roseovarius sp. D22-M7 TaxID=3127116 RepID=UPI00300FDCCF
MICSIVVASRFLAVGAGVPSARGDLAVATQALLQAGTPAANLITKLEQARMNEGERTRSSAPDPGAQRPVHIHTSFRI